MLTVFIATHNRSRLLSQTLHNLTSLHRPASGWKLVVIDNASTDDTKKVIQSFQNLLPLTYKYEPVIGKNAALNTGLTELEGDLAVFTDDDVAPKPDWLLQLRAGADANPGYQMFGGVIVPRWQVPPPAWIAHVPQAPLFSTTDEHLQSGPTDAGNLFGPNLAIRSEIFHGGIRFDESIGPRGKSYPMGSETELLLRLSRRGLKAWHIKDAVVEHYVRENQMRRSWVLDRAVRQGRGQFRLSVLQQNRHPGWPTVAFSIVPRMLKRVARILLASVTVNRRKLINAQWEFNYNLGFLVEAFRMERESVPASAPLPTLSKPNRN